MRKEVLVSVAVLLVLSGLNVADQAALAPVVPLITEDLGINDPAMGLVGSIYIASMGVSMLVSVISPMSRKSSKFASFHCTPKNSS